MDCGRGVVRYGAPLVRTSNPARSEADKTMAIQIKLEVSLSVQESALEDAMAEFDELTVSQLVAQVIDKAIAVEHVSAAVTQGPNSLEEYDKAREA